MSKPSIQNIVTTQTFQNWLDKTNEMVDIMRDSALTASVSGDTTVGDAALVGEFTANNVVVFNELLVDYAESRTAGENIAFGSAINIVPALSPIAATFNYGAGGGRTRYTDGVVAWDVGFDNSTDANFQINQGGGGQFSLSPAGVLTVPSIVTEAGADVSFGGDVTIEVYLPQTLLLLILRQVRLAVLFLVILPVTFTTQPETKYLKMVDQLQVFLLYLLVTLTVL